MKFWMNHSSRDPEWSAIAAHYDVGERFLSGYLDYWNSNVSGRTIHSLAEIQSLVPPQSYWMEYALTTNSRGKVIFDLLFPHLSPKSERFLDVGCGFGGCVVAFARNGFRAVGVDIDMQRVEFSRLNTEDHGFSDIVHMVDILSDAADSLGKFDVITCTDVIEHVLDPRRTMKRLIEMLEPNGTLLLEIPNKDSMNFIARDGHFGLFGITQLDRPNAIQYHATQFSSEYDVGHYHPLDFYLNAASDEGCQSHLIANPMHPSRDFSQTQPLLAQMLTQYEQFLVKVRPALTDTLAGQVSESFSDYGAQLWRELARVALNSEHLKTFSLRYLTDFWTLIVKKSGL